MSDENALDKLCCATCGIAEVDDAKLKERDACDLVRYCSDACQKNHKSHHVEDCKKRAAELRDELLFKQPKSSHLGDCPICMLPLPLDLSKSKMASCCIKVICLGCDHANDLRIDEGKLQHTCPFCREATPSTDEGSDNQRMKRVEVNDPAALTHEGIQQCKKDDYRSAFEWYTRAAELGDVDAHYRLSVMYYIGHGVEKDKGKEVHHLEEAAIGGHPSARYYLGVYEWNNDYNERAVKHWIIAATQGNDQSIKALMGAFRRGMISKDDLAAALRAHQAAVDATKSHQRKVAEIATYPGKN